MYMYEREIFAMDSIQTNAIAICIHIIHTSTYYSKHILYVATALFDIVIRLFAHSL